MKLYSIYKKQIYPKLAKEFEIKNKMAVPNISKIVVNIGIGDATKDKGVVKSVSDVLATITGQKPSLRAAKKSIAGFGLREGMPVGLKVTLRGKRMYDFFEKLVAITLPRLRDFRGLSTSSFDGHGNYSLGLNDYTVFPEIDLTKVKQARGIEITIVTNTNDVEKSKKLLGYLGMPFKKK